MVGSLMTLVFGWLSPSVVPNRVQADGTGEEQHSQWLPQTTRKTSCGSGSVLKGTRMTLIEGFCDFKRCEIPSWKKYWSINLLCATHYVWGQWDVIKVSHGKTTAQVELYVLCGLKSLLMAVLWVLWWPPLGHLRFYFIPTVLDHL